MKRNSKKRKKHFFVFFAISLCMLAGVLAAGYFYLYGKNLKYHGGRAAPQPQAEQGRSQLKMYYPAGGSLHAENRVVSPAIEDSEEAAQAVVEQYLAGPAGMTDPAIPAGAKLLGLYFGTNGVLYVDFSQEFKSNFHGDALTEYLLLRGLYKSLMSNVRGIDNVMVLVGGRETESIGGHILADRPLGQLPAVNAVLANAAFANTAGGIKNGE